MDLLFEQPRRGRASVPLIISHGHSSSLDRGTSINLILRHFHHRFTVYPSQDPTPRSHQAHVYSFMCGEAPVTAWQGGCERLVTGRWVPQLVAAEENRTSCQPSRRRPPPSRRLAPRCGFLRRHGALTRIFGGLFPKVNVRHFWQQTWVANSK